MKPIKVTRNNKTVISKMIGQYTYMYVMRFCEWFDSKSGAVSSVR